MGYPTGGCRIDNLEEFLQELIRSKQFSIMGDALSPPSPNVRGYPCSVSWCNRPAYAKGLCNAHYLRARSGKSMNDPIETRSYTERLCECGRSVDGKGGWGLCSKCYKKQRATAIKAGLVQFFGGKCSECGKSYPDCVYDFHHIEEKEGSPSYVIANGSISAIVEELSKCILLCANCHRVVHYGE